MAKLTFLGTCSGTEPMPNRHHSAFVIEINGIIYWFDAGENCSHKAHNMKFDLSRVRAIFISHMHIDHIGGLANLMFTMRKLEKVTKVPHIHNNSYDIFVPDIDKFQSIKNIADIPAIQKTGVISIEHEICDGLLFEDENIRVTALHNTHLKETGENGWHSYSFLIEISGKRIVFSGDVTSPEELNPYTNNGCDVLIMETGHHTVERVFSYAASKNVKQLLLTHHGREILRDVLAAEQFASVSPVNGMICHDGDTVVV